MSGMLGSKTYSGKVGMQVDRMSFLQKPETGEQSNIETIMSDRLQAEINAVTVTIRVLDLTETSDLYCKSNPSLIKPRLQ